MNKESLSRSKVEVVCEFCRKRFYREVYKLTRSNRPNKICCKSCNGISAAYTRVNSHMNPREFFKIHKAKLVNHTDLVFENGEVYHKCGFCLRRFRIRADFARIKRVNCCKDCRSINNNYNRNNKELSKREFYLQFKSKIQFRLIDINETKNRFGYDPHFLPIHSEKLIVVRCEFCLNNFETKFKNLKNPRFGNCNHCLSIARSYKSSRSVVNKRDFYLQFDGPVISEFDRFRTIRAFGYDPVKFAPSSKKRVIVDCHYCGDEVAVSIRSLANTNIPNVPACKKCRKKKLSNSLMNKYGVASVNLIPDVQLKMSNPLTNRLVEHLLRQRYKVDFIREYAIKNLQFDFFVPSCNLLIECQGDYFHNFKNNGYSGTARDKGKATYVKRHTDHKLIWIWEHEIHLGRLIKILDFHVYESKELKIHIKDLADTSIRPIDKLSSQQFLSRYHYIGGFTPSSRKYGAFYDDELVCVAIFGGITRSQSVSKINRIMQTKYSSKDIRELKRFCIRPNVVAKNLASYLLKRFIDALLVDIPVSAILSFSDPTVCDVGTIYKASGWTRLSDTTKSYHYLDSKSGRLIHKKTIWDMAKKLKMKEVVFAKSTGLYRVDELPKSVWLKIIKTF